MIEMIANNNSINPANLAQIWHILNGNTNNNPEVKNMPYYEREGKLIQIKIFRIGFSGHWYAKNAKDSLSISYLARAKTRVELEKKLTKMGYVQSI